MCTRLRSDSSRSNAPARARFSIWRRLPDLGSRRSAKSDRDLNGPLARRSATRAPIAAAPTLRTAHVETAAPGEVKVAFVPSTTQRRADGTETFVYKSVLDTNAPPIKSVAFRPPLTFEIIDPQAAKDSFSEITATLTTSGGSKVDVVCPLSSLADGKLAKRKVTDDALEIGRFVGQIIMNLGDKDSPPTIVLEPGDTRTLAPRRRTDQPRDPVGSSPRAHPTAPRRRRARRPRREGRHGR